MDPSQTGELTRQLDDFIEAYQSACARGLRPEIEAFLPEADHPLRRQVATRSFVCVIPSATSPNNAAGGPV